MNYQRETMVSYLREYGITYLAPSDAVATETIATEEELISGLVTSTDERLQMALVPLFIRQPHLSQHVPSLIDTLPTDQALNLQTYYMAAVYLQRIWQIRLGFYIDNSELLPDIYSQEMKLPPPEERFGKVGLYELVDSWQQRSKFPFNYMASLNKTMDLLFAELKLAVLKPEYAPTN